MTNPVPSANFSEVDEWSDFFQTHDSITPEIWYSIREIFSIYCSLPVGNASGDALLRRLAWCLRDVIPDTHSARSVAIDITSLVSYPSTWDSQELQSELSKFDADAHHSIEFLRRTYGSWVNDAISSSSRSFRDWIDTDSRYLLQARRSGRKFAGRIAMEIHLINGETLSFESQLESFTRLVSALCTVLARAPEEIWDSTDVELLRPLLETISGRISEIQNRIPPPTVGDDSESELSVEES